MALPHSPPSPPPPQPGVQWCTANEDTDPPPKAAVSQHPHSPSIGNGAGAGCRGAAPAAASASAEVSRSSSPTPPNQCGHARRWRASPHPGLQAPGGGPAPPRPAAERGALPSPPPPPPQRAARDLLPPPPPRPTRGTATGLPPPPPRPADAAGCAPHAWPADMQSRRDSHRAPPQDRIKSDQPPPPSHPPTHPPTPFPWLVVPTEPLDLPCFASLRRGGGGGWHKALVVGSGSLWRRLLASRP